MKVILVGLILLTSFLIKGQDANVIDRDFVFAEGIYMTIDDLKANNPISPKDIIALYTNIENDENKETRKELNDESVHSRVYGKVADINQSKYLFRTSWEELQDHHPNFSIFIDKMAVNDKNGIIEIELDSAFAISINNNLFINISTRKRFGKENDKEKNFNSINYFSRVLFQGSVMLVSANESNFAKTFQGGTTSQRNINSNSGPTPYPSINTQLPKHQNPSLGNYSMPTKKQKGPMQQFMFFVEDGNVKILNVENVLELISNDDELLSKYESMKDAKNLLPYFVKKYNESHPLYFID